MKTFILFFLFVFGVSNAQDTEIIEPNSAEKQFELDLKNNSLKIYVQGGIVSALKKEDVEFAKSYNISYYEFGCLAPANPQYYQEYNNLVFKQLDQRFGSEWQSKLNRSSIGIQKS